MDPLIRPAEPKREYEALAVDIDAALLRVARSGWFIQGPEHDAFEAEFAAYLGVAACVGVANGTDALELALRAVGAGPGSEVVTAANAGGYTSTATRSIGAHAVYAEVDPDHLLLDPAAVADALTPATAAVVVTHLYGHLHPAIRELVAICERAGVALIEDCAQSHGARLDGRAAGTFGRVATFSFYPTKNLGALGDGGALVTNDLGLAGQLRALRQYGWTERYCATVAAGRNSRLDEMQAAVLRVKLPHLDEWNLRRRAVVDRYRAAAPSRWWAGSPDPSDIAHLAVTRSHDRARLRAHLEAAGVGTAIHFPTPDHRQPAMPTDARLPITERVCDEVLSLPCHAFMTDHEVDRVCMSLADYEE